MDFFLLLIFDPEPEEVVFLCILSMFYIFNKNGMLADNNDKIFLILIKRRRIKSIEILLIQKGEIFVIVLSTGATERYILFLYPFLDYMRPKTRNDKKKKITIRFQIEKLQSFRFVRGDKKRGTIYL
ncbi:hypothetical protein ACJX0J_003012 [Zea mays]